MFIKKRNQMSPIKMSKIEPALRVAIKYTEYFNAHNTSGILTLLNSDCIFDAYFPAPNGTVFSGLIEIETYLNDLFNSNPIIKIELEDVFGFGHRSVLQWKYLLNEKGSQNEYIRGVDLIIEKNSLISHKMAYIKG